MHTKIRKSGKKHRKMTGFLKRKKTRGGKKILRNQRKVANSKA